RARSRLWWATRPGLGVKAAVAILLAGLLLTAWALLRPPPGVVDRPPGPSAAATGGTSGAASASIGSRAAEASETTGGEAPAGGRPGAGAAGGEQILVHVAGAVASPGLVTLPAGARIADAITAAGGPAADADLAAVNLAAPARDGE